MYQQCVCVIVCMLQPYTGNLCVTAYACVHVWCNHVPAVCDCVHDATMYWYICVHAAIMYQQCVWLCACCNHVPAVCVIVCMPLTYACMACAWRTHRHKYVHDGALICRTARCWMQFMGATLHSITLPDTIDFKQAFDSGCAFIKTWKCFHACMHPWPSIDDTGI